MEDIRQNLSRKFVCIFLGTLLSYVASATEIDLDIDYDHGEVRDIIFGEPWLHFEDNRRITYVKLLVERSNGLMLVPPFRRLIMSVDGDVKTISEFKGHDVDIEKADYSCFNIVLRYHSGSNLEVLKLFKLNSDGDIYELTTGFSIESNIGNINVGSNQIVAENIVTKDGSRYFEKRYFKILNDNSGNFCLIK